MGSEKPSLFDKVTPDMSLYNHEIFGPVLSVVRVASYKAALGLINSNPYGNGTAIFTNDGGAPRSLPERGGGWHGRHQRAHPRTGFLLLIRRLERIVVWRQPRGTGPKASISSRGARW